MLQLGAYLGVHAVFAGVCYRIPGNGSCPRVVNVQSLLAQETRRQ
jgi:hypothetical protein